MIQRFTIVIVYLSLLLCGPALVAQSKSSAELLAELEAANRLLNELELLYDQNDPRLVESLEQLADRHIALQQFDEAHTILDRAIQITRVANGLYTPAQLTLLKKKLENYANRGNWQDVRDQSEHLFWLYREKTPVAENLVYHFKDLADMHLRGVAEDESDLQSYHFRWALEAHRLALFVARKVWGEYDIRTVPLVYSVLKQYHLHVVAIDHGGRTGYELRELVPGSRWVQEKGTVQRAHYYSGLNLLRHIKDVYALADPPDLEGVAMSELYLADWQVLFGRRDEALESYQSAYAGLLDADLEKALVDSFFTQPKVLPVLDFHPNLMQALTGSDETEGEQVETDANVDVGTRLTFLEWSPSFPGVRAPTRFNSFYEPSTGFALFSFSLPGLNRVSNWTGGRFRSGIGVAQEGVLLNAEFSAPVEEERLLRKLHSLRFRPALSDGNPSEASGTLKFFMADQQF